VGKTTALKFLEDAGTDRLTAVTRYMPRDRRPSDTVGDKPWSFEPHSDEGRDPTGPGEIIFANVKYKGYYGFPGADIRRSLEQGASPVMLVTSYVEMTQLAEALHNSFPAVPIITVRLEVPQEVLPGRITRRVGADPREHEERIARLNDLVNADLLQTPLLHEVFGTRVIWNVRAEEVRSYGYFATQIPVLTGAGLAAMVAEARCEALERTQWEANDIVTPRPLTYSSAVVPAAVIDVLDDVLIPAAAERLCGEDDRAPGETPIILKAGLAAALYLGDKGRIVSPDIDFVLREHPHARRHFELLMEWLCDGPVAWTDGKSKAVYHCEGIKGVAAARDGTRVELDAHLATNVQPDPNGFVFQCRHDDNDLFHRRMVETPAGNRVAMVPPEQLCVEKLLAGRGPEIGKFDLFDASGLLALYRLNPHIIKKMVESQRFDEGVDAAAAAVVARWSAHPTDDDLRGLGITEPGIRLAALQMGPLVDDAAAEYPSERRALTLTALKQLAFLSAVERSLKKIETIMDAAVFAIGAERVSIGERFGDEDVRRGIAPLRAEVQLLAQFYVGMRDTFVRRPLTSEREERAFFRHLDEQRRRLTPETQRGEDAATGG